MNETTNDLPEPPTKRAKTESTTQWFLYPSKKARSCLDYTVGQSVIVKPAHKTNGTSIELCRGKIKANHAKEKIIEVSVEDAESDDTVVRLRGSDRSLLLPAFLDEQSGPNDVIVLITDETTPFRQMVYHAQKTDHCLEIGCSSGETSRMLVPHVKRWVGFDTSDEMIEKCKETVKAALCIKEANDEAIASRCHWAKIDALVDPQRAEREARYFGATPDCVYLDIGGNRESVNVLRMLSFVLSTFGAAKLVVVKSRELVQKLRASATIDKQTGKVANCMEWFKEHKLKRARPKHPLRAPLVLSPKDYKTPICRYHNYHKDGCSKADCPFDHKYCHSCIRKGHVAMNCPELT